MGRLTAPFVVGLPGSSLYSDMLCDGRRALPVLPLRWWNLTSLRGRAMLSEAGGGRRRAVQKAEMGVEKRLVGGCSFGQVSAERTRRERQDGRHAGALGLGVHVACTCERYLPFSM